MVLRKFIKKKYILLYYNNVFAYLVVNFINLRKIKIDAQKLHEIQISSNWHSSLRFTVLENDVFVCIKHVKAKIGLHYTDTYNK